MTVIETGYQNSKSAWRESARKAVVHVARRSETFTIDDVREVMDSNGTLKTTHDLRSLGGVMRTAQKLGVVEVTDEYAPSAHGHGRPIAVWRSLIR